MRWRVFVRAFKIIYVEADERDAAKQLAADIFEREGFADEDIGMEVS